MRCESVTCIVVYTVHVISQNIDGGTTEADGGASAPVGLSVATPLLEFIVIEIEIYYY